MLAVAAANAMGLLAGGATTLRFDASLARSAAPVMETVELTEQQVKAYGGDATRPLSIRAGAAAPAAAVSSGGMSLEGMFGAGPETGVGPWDPLGFATERFGDDPDKLLWYRAAEIKHGRVAMAATVGYMVNAKGIFWPGAIDQSGTLFSDLANPNPFAVWDAVPDSGKAQIVLFVGFLEFLNEAQKPHYMMPGGMPGKFDALWLKFPQTGAVNVGRPDEKKAASRLAELKNGRLAMIGIASFYAANVVPGSVPALPMIGAA